MALRRANIRSSDVRGRRWGGLGSPQVRAALHHAKKRRLYVQAVEITTELGEFLTTETGEKLFT